MAVLPITIYGEPVLHRVASEVTDFGPDLQGLIEDMFETMDAARGVGLAATQVGVGLRLFTYEFANEDGVPARGVVVNPVLQLGKISQELPDPEEESEGCLSVPGGSYPLKRAEWVKVNGLDREGNPLSFEATGWFARVMQHETDHLNGKLYVDKLVDRHKKRAFKFMKNRKWLVPGNTWMPGVDKDPFGHDD